MLSNDWTSNTLQFIMITDHVGCDGPELFVFQFAVQQYKDSNIRNYNLPVILYGWETWSLMLGEEHKKVFWPNNEEVGLGVA